MLFDSDAEVEDFRRLQLCESVQLYERVKRVPLRERVQLCARVKLREMQL